MAVLVALCSSERRQEPKKNIPEAVFVKGSGIMGDSHFGFKDRQVSLLRSEDIEEAEKKAGFPFPPGSLAENIVMRGLPADLAIGTSIGIGDEVLLRVVERGKKPGEPHSYDYRGWCLLPECGLFLEVLQGGSARKGDNINVIEP